MAHAISTDSLMVAAARPDKMRPFNSEIFDVKFQNNLEEPFSPFFHFTLGSHIKRVDNRDSYVTFTPNTNVTDDSMLIGASSGVES